MRSRSWLFGLVLASTTLVAAGDPVSLQVNPSVSLAPATLGIRVRVAPESDNRALEIVVDSDEFYRLSRIQLDGDRAPSVNTLRLESVPAGGYDVTASVIGVDGGRRALARAHVEVMSPSAGR
jgi:hypothetical protein